LKYNHEKVASSRSELPDTRKFSGLKSNAFCIHYKTHQMQLRKPDHAADHNGDQASRRGGQSADHEGIQQLEAFVWIMTGILKGFPALRQRNLGNFLSKGING
jgi:hypothetical protein